MHHFVVSITILVLMSLHAQGTLRCDCKRAKQCIRPTSCPTGYRYDMCNCCEVCAKAEGEVCGGSNYVEGQCGHGMGCIVRDVRSRRNRRKRAVRELIGRCEVCKYAWLHWRGRMPVLIICDIFASSMIIFTNIFYLIVSFVRDTSSGKHSFRTLKRFGNSWLSIFVLAIDPWKRTPCNSLPSSLWRGMDLLN